MELREFVAENRGGGFLVCVCLPLKEISNWTEKFWFDVEITDYFKIIPEQCCIYLLGECLYFTYFPKKMISKSFLTYLETVATKRVEAYLKLKAKDGKSQRTG